MFEQPYDTDVLHCVRFTDCSSQLDLRHWEFESTEFLSFNQLTAEEMIGFVALINQKIYSYRNKQVHATKLYLGYILIGLFVVVLFITMVAVFLSFWLSFVAVVFYFIGLFCLGKRTSKVQSEMDKAVFFNMAFVIHNLNKTELEKKYQMRCKLGHMGQWIEFHSLRRRSNSVTGQNNSKSENEELLEPEPSITKKKSEK